MLIAVIEVDEHVAAA